MRAQAAVTAQPTIDRGRWLQLSLGVAAMLAISSPQYVWTLFVQPFRDGLGVSLSAVQVTFALFSIFQCGLGPLHGQLAARSPPRRLVAIGGALVGASWILSAFAPNIWVLYLTYGVLSGIGTGFVYVAVIELMVRYFPDRRGFAIGMAAGSYGLGAIVTTFPIAGSLQSAGLQTTLTQFGLVLSAIIVLAALGMRRPTSTISASPAVGTGSTPGQMLRTPMFWAMFIVMTMVATGGLMVISQLSPFAASLGIGPATLAFGVPALALALTIDRIANGLTRPFFGLISDRIGREPTMAIAFGLEALAVFLLFQFGADPIAFVLLTGLVFFGWGEIYSLFPALQADVFGETHAVKNFGYLLVGTAIASVLGAPTAAYIVEQTGSWRTVFYAMIALDLLAVALALALLRPLRLKMQRQREPYVRA